MKDLLAKLDALRKKMGDEEQSFACGEWWEADEDEYCCIAMGFRGDRSSTYDALDDPDSTAFTVALHNAYPELRAYIAKLEKQVNRPCVHDVAKSFLDNIGPDDGDTP